MVERLEREKEEVQGSMEEAVRERNRRAEELLQLPQARVEPGLQKDGNMFPANLRFWQPLLASQLKCLQK